MSAWPTDEDEEAGVLRKTVCLIVNHKWTSHRYPATKGEDQPEGTYRKCLRCGKVDEGGGSGLPLPTLGA